MNQRERSQKWNKEHPERMLAARKRYRERNLEKLRARERDAAKKVDPLKAKCRKTVRMAALRGKIIKPKNCTDCGREAVLHAHHHDYTKPFDVEWLCSKCHGLRHRKEAQG